MSAPIVRATMRATMVMIVDDDDDEEEEEEEEGKR